MRTIASLKADLIRKLHGTSLSKLESVNELIGESARNVLARIDPQETVRYSLAENALFDDLYLYSCPADLKGDKIIDLGPQADRSPSQNYSKVMIEEFTRKKRPKDINILYRNGTKFLRVNAPSAPTKKTISEFGELTGWSASGSASNPAIDDIEAVAGGSSYRFDITNASGTAVITNSTLDSLDLSDDENLNEVFFWLYVPDASKITSVSIRYGSDASNYVSASSSVPVNAPSIEDGWNLFRFPLEDATETGTVDWSAMVYLQITINHDATGEIGLRLDSATVGAGKAFELYFYSSRLFKTTAGALLETPNDDTNIILLEQDAYNILLYECAYVITQELQGENGSWDESFLAKKLNGVPGDPDQPGLYKQYERSYPSQNKKAKSRYYEFASGNYRS